MTSDVKAWAEVNEGLLTVLVGLQHRQPVLHLVLPW